MCWDKILVGAKTVRKWTIYSSICSLTTIIPLLYLAISTLSNYNFSFPLDDLITNWQRSPIQSVTSSSTCSDDYLISYNWSGIQSGCDCSLISIESYSITLQFCSAKQLANNCVYVSEKSSQSFHSWEKQTLPSTLLSSTPCKKNLSQGQTFLSNNFASNSPQSCVSPLILCGSSGYSMCLTTCPLIDILNSSDGVLPSNSVYVTSNIDSTLYLSFGSLNDQKYPIVEILASTVPICLHYSDTTPTNQDYQLFNKLNYDCSEVDTRYELITTQSIYEINFLSLNGININTNSGYPQTTQISLYQRRITSWKDACRTADYVNKLYQFYTDTGSQQTIRQLLIILISVMVMIMMFILIAASCEEGYKRKYPFCCKYQSPSCISRVCRKRNHRETSIFDYISLFDPVHGFCAILFCSVYAASIALSVVIGAQSIQDYSLLNNIADSECSDAFTNNLLLKLSNDYSDNVKQKDLIFAIILVLYSFLAGGFFIILVKTVVNHKREYFRTKMEKINLERLKYDDPLLTTEESEQEKILISRRQAKAEEKMQQEQAQILQDDFLKRCNQLSQSLMQFYNIQNQNQSHSNINNNGNNVQNPQNGNNNNSSNNDNSSNKMEAMNYSSSKNNNNNNNPGNFSSNINNNNNNNTSTQSFSYELSRVTNLLASHGVSASGSVNASVALQKLLNTTVDVSVNADTSRILQNNNNNSTFLSSTLNNLSFLNNNNNNNPGQQTKRNSNNNNQLNNSSYCISPQKRSSRGTADKTNSNNKNMFNFNISNNNNNQDDLKSPGKITVNIIDNAQSKVNLINLSSISNPFMKQSTNENNSNNINRNIQLSSNPVSHFNIARNKNSIINNNNNNNTNIIEKALPDDNKQEQISNQQKNNNLENSVVLTSQTNNQNNNNNVIVTFSSQVQKNVFNSPTKPPRPEQFIKSNTGLFASINRKQDTSLVPSSATLSPRFKKLESLSQRESDAI